ncbi:MAG: TonB-dependent receptor [Bacteroidia bacterium]
MAAQTAVVTGTVSDKETKQHLEDVIVSINGTITHTHTDTAGKFSFILLPAGNYELEISKFGFETQKLKVAAAENETVQLNIALVFNPKALNVIDVEAERTTSAASSKYLSAIDFQNRPKNSAQDMLRLVPGLFIAQHAGGGKAEQIFIRGFDCDHGTDVATYVDGMPVNMPSHGHGQGYEDLHFLIPETVQGMDIFKGPYSVQYGDFATGAAVRFNTADTLETNLILLEGAAVPTAGNITSKRLLGLFQIPKLSDNISSYIAADIINNRGYFERSQDFNRFNLFSKTMFRISDHSNLSFSASGFSSSWNASGQIPERAVSNGWISRYGSLDPTEGGVTSRNNLNIIYRSSGEHGELESQVYSCNYHFKLFSDFTFYLHDPVNGDEIEQDDTRSVHGLNMKYTIPHSIGKSTERFSIGASFRSDEIENQLWHAVKRERLEARAHAMIHQRSSGVFANEAFRFNDHFRLELGARYDYFTFDVEDLLPADSTHTNYTGYNYQTLFSPKVNFIYTANNNLQLFINVGGGYHSNDARSAVQEPSNHQLPRSVGGEIGTLAHAGRKIVTSAALWWLETENELVYAGDDGTTENKGSSRRLGIDLSTRYQITPWLFADADLNLSQNELTAQPFGDRLGTNHYIPLAPIATSAGGLTLRHKKVEAGLRYRYMAARPANESNSVTAKGYTILDLSLNYKTKRMKIGFSIENLLNTEWNEAQFDTESRLPFEDKPVDELHFTPGTPLSAKVSAGYVF